MHRPDLDTTSIRRRGLWRPGVLLAAVPLLFGCADDPGVTGGDDESGSDSTGATAGEPGTSTTAAMTTSGGTTAAMTTSGGTTATTSATSTGGPETTSATGGPGTTTTTGGPETTTSTTGEPGTSSTGEPCLAGALDCPCLPKQVCDGDLVCAADLCVEPAPGVCGDGVVDDGEACDDGNDDDFDACTSACALNTCGDGVVQPGEACDDGDDDDADGCTALCQTTQVLEVGTSLNATCVRLSGGAVKCWGSGDLSQYGQPGYGEPIGDDEVPAAIPPIQLGGPAVQLAQGSNHVCAVMADASLRCWGYSNFGQHGLGHKMRIGDDEHPAAAPPVMIGGPTLAVASSDEHSCALLAGGGVRCFGYNISGDLGYGHQNHVGDNEHPSTQPLIKLGEPATAVITGHSHSCALLASKQVRCWGTNLSGQLGLGVVVNVGDNDHPVDFPPPPLGDVERIAAGDKHTCVLQSGGVVRCFGDNHYGQLGYGHTTDLGDNESADGGPVELGGKAIQIECGTNVSCALLEGGAVRCWGWNKYGQLGLGHLDHIGDDEVPTAAPPIDLGGDAIDISTSGYHTCAVLEGGAVRCWGYPSNGALGLGAIVVIGDDEHPADVAPIQVF